MNEIKEILFRRFEGIDYVQSKSDVLPFIHNPASLEIWSKDFFQSITNQLTAQS